MAKIYVDVTELAGWQGKLTGVPRVMDELVRRFAVSEEVSFVTWRPEGYSSVSYPLMAPSSKLTVVTPVGLHIRAAKKLHRNSKIVRKGVSALRQMKRQQSVVANVSIDAGDKLVILADWHGGDPSFVQYLMNAHERGVRLVQVVYDLLPLVTPQYSGHSTEMLKNYSTKIYPLCDLIFSISEHTKKDIQQWLDHNGLRTPPIKVFRLGDDFARKTVAKPSVTLPDEFILCVGTIEARKNHTLLYYAYKLAKQKGLKLPKIIVVGRVGWLAEDSYRIITTDPDTKDQFVFLHGIGDDELAWLYENCLFSIYPSFYEGWGLPIAESIAHGKPVVASNTSSMPEIAGDLIQYFSPASTEECLDSIVGMLKKPRLKQATERIKKYVPRSWDDSYAIIRDEIEKVK